MEKEDMESEQGPIPAPTYVLYLPAPSQTIWFRGYAHEVSGFTLAGWLLERLSRQLAGESFLVLSHAGVDEGLMERLAAPYGIPVLTAGGETRLEALAEIASVLPGRAVVSFFPEVAFARSGTVRAIWEHHARTGNQYTWVPNLPYGVGPEVFDSELLVGVGRVRFEGPAPDLTLVVQRLILARAGEGEGTKIRATPFPAPVTGGAGRLPAFSIETAVESRKAKECLADLPEAYDLAPLERWHLTKETMDRPQWKSTEADVLFISPWSGYSGAEECLVSLVEGLGRLGWERAALFGVEDLLAERCRERGADVYCANWPFEKAGELSTEFAKAVFEAIRPKVIHCNFNPGGALLEEARRLGIPVVTHMRTPDVKLYGPALGGAAHFIAVSEYTKRFLVASGVTAESVAVIYDGVDAEKFRPGVYDPVGMKREFGYAEDDFVVLLVARLVPEKRHDVVLRAAAMLRGELPRLRIVFVGNKGNPGFLHKLMQLGSELGVEDIVRWLPFQPDIRKIEIAADVVVLCSELEALGTCILEGMALGKPVVVTEGIGLAEVVREPRCGMVIGDGAAEELAAAIRLLAGDAELRAELGRAARERILEGFTLDVHARQVAGYLATRARSSVAPRAQTAG